MSYESCDGTESWSTSNVAHVSMVGIELSQTIKRELTLVDVRLLDHFIVAGAEVLSMVQAGQV